MIIIIIIIIIITIIIIIIMILMTKNLHGTGKCGIPIPPVVFLWERELNYLN